MSICRYQGPPDGEAKVRRQGSVLPSHAAVNLLCNLGRSSREAPRLCPPESAGWGSRVNHGRTSPLLPISNIVVCRRLEFRVRQRTSSRASKAGRTSSGRETKARKRVVVKEPLDNVPVLRHSEETLGQYDAKSPRPAEKAGRTLVTGFAVIPLPCRRARCPVAGVSLRLLPHLGKCVLPKLACALHFIFEPKGGFVRTISKGAKCNGCGYARPTASPARDEA